MGDTVTVEQREAARRTQPGQGDGGDAMAPEAPQMRVFDADFAQPRLRALALENEKDPLLHAINNLYTDRQEYGRLAYDSAYKHAAVAAAFDGRLAILASKKPTFAPQTSDPTPTQEKMADFANYIISQLRWTQFIDGPIGMGLKYGFSLSEIVTKEETWRGNPAITLERLYALPQATLDNGFVPRYEYQYVDFLMDGRYRCFRLDANGRIAEIVQFAYSGSLDTLQTPAVTWEGPKMEKILHFKHKGGDGNPYGQSALYTCMESWASLYALEKMEEVFLDTALPVLFGTYKTENGRSRPDLHADAKSGMGAMYLDASHRLIMWPDGDLKSVAPSNENFTTHVKQKKMELEGHIWQAQGFPKSLVAETAASDTDSRNLIQVFFKHSFKYELQEIGETLEDLTGRLLRANFGDIKAEEYPVAKWSFVTENEMRVAQNLLTALLPHLDSESLPGFVHELFDFVDPKYIARTHADSVEIKRPRRDSNDEPNTVTGDPPPKEEGETRERTDGETETPSGVIDTSA